MVITVYTFRDKDNNEYGSFHTQTYKEAQEYARACHLRIIANEFEWADSEELDDFTRAAEEETKAEEEEG